MAKSIETVKWMRPRHIVPVQLNILTPVGTAMRKLEAANVRVTASPRPTANMWWAHTP